MSQHNPFITTRIADAMESLGGLDEQLPAAILKAGEIMAAQLVAEQKIIALGLDNMEPLAAMFCNRLMYGNAELRPALPALLLDNNTQLKSLGNSGDCLLLVGESVVSSSMQNGIRSATAMGLQCIVIGQSGTSDSALNIEPAHYLPIDTKNLTRMHEVALFILNCLSDTIEQQLFGDF